jgi:hypothetical protein
MAELIATIIFVLSFLGILFIFWRKMPILAQLPDVHEGMQKDGVMGSIREKAKSILPNELHIVKWLSKIRVWILKLEKYIDNLLQKTRKVIVQNNRRGAGNGRNKKTPGSGMPPAPPI